MADMISFFFGSIFTCVVGLLGIYVRQRVKNKAHIADIVTIKDKEERVKTTFVNSQQVYLEKKTVLLRACKHGHDLVNVFVIGTQNINDANFLGQLTAETRKLLSDVFLVCDYQGTYDAFSDLVFVKTGNPVATQLQTFMYWARKELQLSPLKIDNDQITLNSYSGVKE